MTTKELIEKTKQLIRIPSTQDNPRALRDVFEAVADMVAACPGVNIEFFERNGKPSLLAYRGTERPKTFDVLLNGHLDVVPADPEQFEPQVKDGRLYGRGALDMKGTTVILTDVFCELVNEVPYSLGLQIVTDEEIGGYDGTRLQIDEGVRAKFVIMGEYANDRHTIYNAARGLCWAEIAFSGKTAHGGHLWHGTNAVVKAGDFAGAVLKRYPTPDKETWTTTASIANLSTPNETYNKVPDSAILKVDFRFTQEDPVFQSRESLEAFITSLDPDARLVNLATFEPAVNVETLNPYVQGMSAAMRQVTGKKPRFLGRPAGSDGRHYALVNNDIVEYGLYGHGSHSDNEYAELESFAEYQAVLRAFLREPIPAKLQTAKAQAPLHERLLRDLVPIRSVPKSRAANNEALEYAERFLKARGMHIKHFEQHGIRSLVATTTPDNKQPAVLLNAHVDVVPGPDQLFKLRVKDGNFVGRGVMDMKHAVAAYLTVVDQLKDELDEYDFGIMLNSDEETGSNDGAKLLVEQEGYRPGVAIVPDGGNNWQLERFAKGVLWIKVEAAGKVAHASRPWEGDSAIHHLLSALKEIQHLVPANPKPEDTLLSVGTIEGGVAANQLAAAASAVLDVRTGSVSDHKRLPLKIQDICKRHGITYTDLANSPPCVTNPEHPLVKQMTDIVTEITGQSHGTMMDYAVTDGRFFSAAGVPTIVINPECGDIHTDNEWLSRRSFAQFCRVLETYVRQVATRKPVLRTRPQEIARLAERLAGDNAPTHVWYATYGSGLSRENFLKQIRGGQAANSTRKYAGCADQTLPVRDRFLSLPYNIYFAGVCAAWGDGGHINIEPMPSASAHTVARAYLVKLDQFEEIAAQQNERRERQRLPLREAMLHGHATVGDGSGHYDELVFCGIVDGIPMFSLTAVQPELPYRPPTDAYTKLLCEGLSEATNIGTQEAVDYVLATPGIAGHYEKHDIVQFFNEIK